MVYFKALTQHLPEWSEENHERLLDILSLDRDLNLEPPEYKKGVLTIQPCQSTT